MEKEEKYTNTNYIFIYIIRNCLQCCQTVVSRLDKIVAEKSNKFCVPKILSHSIKLLHSKVLLLFLEILYSNVDLLVLIK